MTERITFARWLEDRLVERDLGIRQAAAYIGINHAQLSQYLRGLSYPNPRTVWKLAKYFGVDRDTIRALLPSEQETPRISPPSIADQVAERVIQRLQGGERVVMVVDVEGSAAAGNGTPGAEGYATGSAVKWFRVHVRGTCMDPRIPPDSDVMVDPLAPWSEGAIVIAEHDGAMVCKRVTRRNGRWMLVAEDGTTIDPDDGTRVLGVVWGTALR